MRVSVLELQRFGQILPLRKARPACCLIFTGTVIGLTPSPQGKTVRALVPDKIHPSAADARGNGGQLH